MKATNLKQITVKALLANDEIVTYTLTDRIKVCVKVRTIDGKNVFIKDTYRSGVFSSINFPTLKALKASVMIAHF